MNSIPRRTFTSAKHQEQAKLKTTNWAAASRLASAVLIVAFSYAVIRYVVLKGVSPSHIPLLILDKSIAFTGLFLVGFSLVSGPLARLYPGRFRALLKSRRCVGLSGFYFSCFHVLLAMILLRPAYYPKFFNSDGSLNFIGELSMLAGLVAAGVLSVLAFTSYTTFKQAWSHSAWKKLHIYGGNAVLMFVAVHLIAMGWKSWVDFAHWPNGLPPITLVSVLVVSLVFAIRWTGGKK